METYQEIVKRHKMELLKKYNYSVHDLIFYLALRRKAGKAFANYNFPNMPWFLWEWKCNNKWSKIWRN